MGELGDGCGQRLSQRSWGELQRRERVPNTNPSTYLRRSGHNGHHHGDQKHPHLLKSFSASFESYFAFSVYYLGNRKY